MTANYVSRSLFALFYLTELVQCLTPAQWRSQSIYQVLTDRFARTDGSTTASCDVNKYCGGSFQGIINKLDYIQQMGFTAVRIHVASTMPHSSNAHRRSGLVLS